MDAYREFMETKSDPRTSKWFLMGSPGPTAIIIVTYLYFCISAGPRYMKDRKPYQLKNVMLVYNIFQILVNIYVVHEGLVSGWLNDYSFTCQPVDYSDNPKAIRMASVTWLYFMVKVIELLDTVFFVLRKKNRQITFLHLYHHSMMCVCGYIGVKFLPGGHGTLMGLTNAFVHVIMYTYYLMSAYPELHKYLWWKKYITRMQMTQFVSVGVHNSLVLFSDCNYPKGISFLLTSQAVVFLYMFGKFYIQAYIRPKPNQNSGDHEKIQNVDSQNNISTSSFGSNKEKAQ